MKRIIATHNCHQLVRNSTGVLRTVDVPDGTLLTKATFRGCMLECEMSGDDSVPLGFDVFGTEYTLRLVNQRLLVTWRAPSAAFKVDDAECAHHFATTLWK